VRTLSTCDPGAELHRGPVVFSASEGDEYRAVWSVAFTSNHNGRVAGCAGKRLKESGIVEDVRWAVEQE
jgi:hypothetical protein